MRSFNPDPEKLDQLELICEFPECGRIFYTTNPKAAFCCDSHRGKHFRLKNKERLDQERTWNKAFKENDEKLKKTFNQNEKILSKRELKLIGFDFNVLSKQKRTEDGRPCYVFFDFGLANHPDKENSFEIFEIKNS